MFARNSPVNICSEDKQQRRAQHKPRENSQEGVSGSAQKKKCADQTAEDARSPASGIITRREMSSRSRYAPPLAVTPNQRAIVWVALAGIGGTPVNSSAGKAIKPPPPATALSAPPITPATNSTAMVWRSKYQMYHNALAR